MVRCLAYRHELLLKLFFGSQIEKDIAQYKSTSPDWLYWRMTLQYGILSAKMELEWAEYAARLTQSSKNKKQREKE